MTARTKIYFASDVHLGATALKNNRERESLFVKWLEEAGKDAKAIYLMGDIFDFWYEYRKVVPRGFVRTFGKLADLCDKGIEVHFFIGNHDIWAFSYFEQEVGMIVHRQPFETEINGKKFYLAHGDGLGNYEPKYLFLKRCFHSPVLQWIFSRFHPNLAFTIGHAWSKRSRLSRGKETDVFKGENKEYLYLYAKEMLKQKHFDFFIFGHRHIAVDIEIGESSRFVNLGDWVKLFTYGVFDGEKFELKKVKEIVN